MYCKKCGKKIDEGMELCQECEVNEILFSSERESVVELKKEIEVKQPEEKTAEVKTEAPVEEVVAEDVEVKAKKKGDKVAKFALILGIASILLAVFAKIWGSTLVENYTIVRACDDFFWSLTRKIGFGEELVEAIFELLYKMVKINKGTVFFYSCVMGMMNIGFITSILGGVLGLLGIKRCKKANVDGEKSNKEYIYLIVGAVLSVIALLYIAANYPSMNATYWQLMAYYGI